MRVWPQLILLLFIVYMIHQQIAQYLKRKSPLTKKRLVDGLIGIALLLFVLVAGGFFNVLLR